MKCVNCSNDAVYTVDNPGANLLDYCVRCLPARLHTNAQAGQYPLRKPAKAAPKDA